MIKSDVVLLDQVKDVFNRMIVLYLPEFGYNKGVICSNYNKSNIASFW